MIDTRIRTSAVALVAAAALAVSGCSTTTTPAPGPTSTAGQPSQTGQAGEATSEQCQRLIGDLQAIGDDLARATQQLGSDPFSALGVLASIAGRLGSLEARVTDPELIERIDAIRSNWDALVADAQGAIQSGDAGGVERAGAAVTEIGGQLTELQEFCRGA